VLKPPPDYARCSGNVLSFRAASDLARNATSLCRPVNLVGGSYTKNNQEPSTKSTPSLWNQQHAQGQSVELPGIQGTFTNNSPSHSLQQKDSTQRFYLGDRKKVSHTPTAAAQRRNNPAGSGVAAAMTTLLSADFSTRNMDCRNVHSSEVVFLTLVYQRQGHFHLWKRRTRTHNLMCNLSWRAAELCRFPTL
jgi:hypothetical protein